jgi:hypothetical protein
MVFRQSSTGIFADYRWYLLGAGGIVAFVLGCIGSWQFLHHPAPSDVAYLSLRLFFMETSAGDHTHVPVSLDIARFLAPIVAGYAGLSALALLFRDRLQQTRIPLMRGHVVVCGLGDVGSVFLRHLREAENRVVVIESDAANPNVELCHSLGVPIIVGDAQRERTLQAAGVQRADRLLAVCPHDAVNTEIVVVAGQLATGRSSSVLFLSGANR